MVKSRGSKAVTKNVRSRPAAPASGRQRGRNQERSGGGKKPSTRSVRIRVPERLRANPLTGPRRQRTSLPRRQTHLDRRFPNARPGPTAKRQRGEFLLRVRERPIFDCPIPGITKMTLPPRPKPPLPQRRTVRPEAGKSRPGEFSARVRERASSHDLLSLRDDGNESPSETDAAVARPLSRRQSRASRKQGAG